MQTAARDRRTLGTQLLSVLLLVLALLVIPESPALASPELEGLRQLSGGAQTNTAGQATVTVTWPGSMDALEFTVVMDTHAVDLDRYDLLQLSVLRTQPGVEIRPASWDAPLGGHHREGTLTFPLIDADGNPVLDVTARSLELAIRDVAGVPERVFRWES